MKRRHKFSPRGKNTYRALKLIGLLGFATVRQLCLIVWGNERSTNDNLNRLLEHHYLHQAHEAVDGVSGRGNRIVFLTRTGTMWLLQKGELSEEDIAYHWRGEGHWYPQYNAHNVAVYDVLCAFIKRASEHPRKAIDIRLDPQTLLEDGNENNDSPLQKSRLLPDRIFAIKYNDQIAECYLEVDRGTESKAVWREKMNKYLESPEVMEQAGVFVLCVANSKRRLITLMNWSRDLVDERFMFSSYQEVCYVHERVGKDLSLISKGNPFGKIWYRTLNSSEPLQIF